MRLSKLSEETKHRGKCKRGDLSERKGAENQNSKREGHSKSFEKRTRGINDLFEEHENSQFTITVYNPVLFTTRTSSTQG